MKIRCMYTTSSDIFRVAFDVTFGLNDFFVDLMHVLYAFFCMLWHADPLLQGYAMG